MRRPVIAGNWKMYKLLGEAVDAALTLKPLVANANYCEVVISPVFTAIKTIARFFLATHPVLTRGALCCRNLRWLRL